MPDRLLEMDPVEYRLSDPISVNWAGKPLKNWGTMLTYMHATSATGSPSESFFETSTHQIGGVWYQNSNGDVRFGTPCDLFELEPHDPIPFKRPAPTLGLL